MERQRYYNPGQSMSEYALALSLVAVVAIPALMTLGQTIRSGLDSLVLKPSPPAGSPVQGPAGALTASAPPSSDVPGSPGAAASIQTPPNVFQPVPSPPQPPSGIANPPSPQAVAMDLAKVSADSNAPVETVGSMGDTKKVLANSDSLVQFAGGFETNDPVIYNTIVQLGMKGKEMARNMDAYLVAGTQDEARLSVLQDNIQQFVDIWTGSVFTADVYNRLSSGDQSTVKNLSADILNIASNVSGTQAQVTGLNKQTLGNNQYMGFSISITGSSKRQVSSSGSICGVGSVDTSVSTVVPGSGSTANASSSSYTPGSAQQVDTKSGEIITCGSGKC